MAALLLVLHVMANLVWIGAIASVGWLVSAATTVPEAGRLSRALYTRVANPAFGLSFLCGVGLLLLLGPAYYMHLHWFHGKLTAAVVVIILHHVIGWKARQLAGGSMQSGRGGGILVGALLASAFLVVAFVLLKQSLVP